MIKEIVKDAFFLSQKSKDAEKEDQQVIEDLLDTIKAHANHCVGMAANMIGVQKRIIVIYDEKGYLPMVNPMIIKHSKETYDTKEGCLCHEGEKPTKRYEKIKVRYLDQNFKIKIRTFTGFQAQIIQHEMDHCEGILI
ncbi:peptide deformylase [[Eubacterium] hominis]|uniref:peptide deformylase n=1 Tax=[Eubacterium] hominis TaxID=2764325 RepID=UPI003A4E581D